MQGKRPQQYKDSARMAFYSMIGVFVFMLLALGQTHGCKEFNKDVGEKLKNDPRPLGPGYNYMHPSHWPKKDTGDSEEDSDWQLEMNCGDEAYDKWMNEQ